MLKGGAMDLNNKMTGGESREVSRGVKCQMLSALHCFISICCLLKQKIKAGIDLLSTGVGQKRMGRFEKELFAVYCC